VSPNHRCDVEHIKNNAYNNSGEHESLGEFYICGTLMHLNGEK